MKFRFGLGSQLPNPTVSIPYAALIEAARLCDGTSSARPESFLLRFKDPFGRPLAHMLPNGGTLYPDRVPFEASYRFVSALAGGQSYASATAAIQKLRARRASLVAPQAVDYLIERLRRWCGDQAGTIAQWGAPNPTYAGMEAAKAKAAEFLYAQIASRQEIASALANAGAVDGFGQEVIYVSAILAPGGEGVLSLLDAAQVGDLVPVAYGLGYCHSLLARCGIPITAEQYLKAPDDVKAELDRDPSWDLRAMPQGDCFDEGNVTKQLRELEAKIDREVLSIPEPINSPGSISEMVRALGVDGVRRRSSLEGALAAL